MPNAKAARRAAPPKVLTTSLAMLLSPARAEASRINGARSRGPKTPEGKARSAQNALKHGLRAQKHVVLPEEDAAEFEALEQAIVEELAPVGALQTALAQRVVAATWRLARAERLEADIFEIERVPGRSLGLALIRDCNGARAFGTLLRYRGGTLAELWRALRTLKALQGERAAAPPPQRHVPAPERAELGALPNQPEGRGCAGDSHTDATSGAALPAPGPVGERGPNPLPALAPDPSPCPAPALDAAPGDRTPAPGRRNPASPEPPIQPDGRAKPGETTGFAVLPLAARPESRPDLSSCQDRSR